MSTKNRIELISEKTNVVYNYDKVLNFIINITLLFSFHLFMSAFTRAFFGTDSTFALVSQDVFNAIKNTLTTLLFFNTIVSIFTTKTTNKTLNIVLIIVFMIGYDYSLRIYKAIYGII